MVSLIFFLVFAALILRAVTIAGQELTILEVGERQTLNRRKALKNLNSYILTGYNGRRGKRNYKRDYKKYRLITLRRLCNSTDWSISHGYAADRCQLITYYHNALRKVDTLHNVSYEDVHSYLSWNRGNRVKKLSGVTMSFPRSILAAAAVVTLTACNPVEIVSTSEVWQDTPEVNNTVETELILINEGE